MSWVNHPSPAKIIGQVMSSDLMKPNHPLLEPAAIGVHVLHTVKTFHTLLASLSRVNNEDFFVYSTVMPFTGTGLANWGSQILAYGLTRNPAKTSGALRAPPDTGLRRYDEVCDACNKFQEQLYI